MTGGAVGGRRVAWLWLAAFTLFGLVYIEPMWLLRDLVADDSSYWAHAATLGLDLDLDYSNEPVHWWNRDRTIASHPIGSGLMAAPFVALFSVVDRLSGHPVIADHAAYQHSWSLFGFFFAAAFYFLLGIWLYWRALRLLFPRFDPRLNLLFAISTGVPFYALRRATTAHAFEFGAIALLFWAAVRIYAALREDEDARTWIIIAAFAVPLNLAVRINNLNVLLLGPAILLLLRALAGPSGVRPPWGRVRSALLRLGGWTLVALIPLALFHLAFFGAVYPSPSNMYGRPIEGTASRTVWEMLVHGIGLLPNLVPLVFSSEFGLLYTNPVLLIGGLAVLYLTGRRVASRPSVPQVLTLVAVVGYLGFSTAIVLWWQTTATSYGYRYLFPLYPVGLLGTVWLLRRLGGRAQRSRGWRRWATPAIVALCAVSIVSQTFFSATPELETRPQVNVYGVFHGGSARGYLTRLPAEIVRPESWVSLAARRLAGYYVAPSVARSDLRERVPGRWMDSYRSLYGDVSWAVTVQLTLLLALWALGGTWLVTRPRGPAGRPDGE